MKTPLAWKNVSHARMRAFSALCGISFSILLIFMQLGFHASARTSAILVYDAFDFDVLLISPHYSFIARPDFFPLSRLEQAKGVAGVEDVTPLWIGYGEWRNPETHAGWGMLLLGVDPSDRPFRQESINARLPGLSVPDTAFIDRLSRPEFGRHTGPGTVSEINGRHMALTDDFVVGTGFVSGSTTIMSRRSLQRVIPSSVGDHVNLGLVKIADDTDPREVAETLGTLLGPEVQVLTRDALMKREQHFWLGIKPIGIMFTSGVFVAFVIGAVILYQVLASEVQNRLKEYATLKALGYDNGYIYGVVLRQGLILAGLGFVPAWGFSLVLYYLLRTQALLPVNMELGRVAMVAALTVTMSLVASFFAVRKLRSADPADLY